MNLPTRLACLVRGRRIDRDLDEELQAHLQQLIAQNIAEGVPREDAEAAARRHFGDTLRLRERDQDARGWSWLEDTVRDLRFAFRSLVRAPGYTVSTAATLAVGVGITTAVLIYAGPQLSPTIPVPAADRAVVIGNSSTPAADDRAPLPFFAYTSRFAYLKANTTTLDLLGGIRLESTNLVVDGDPSSVQVGWVTRDYFDLVGARPALGRLFLRDEFGAGDHAQAVVLSWGWWHDRLGGAPGAIGCTIMVNGTARTVIGVLPREFQPPRQFAATDLYLPTMPEITDPMFPFSWMQVLGRLKPGVTREQAGEELNVLIVQAPPVLADSERTHVELRVLPMSAYYRSSRVLWLFAAGVAFLYAIACTNAANLMLARTITRRRELGIRMALGGGRWRIVRHLLSETLLLCGVAGLGAYALALGAIRLFVHAHGWSVESVLGDFRVAATVAGLSVLTGLIVVAIPALRLGRSQNHDVLKEGSGTLGDSRRLNQLRGGLVVTQTTLAVVLLIGAGLALENFRRLASADPGFNPQNKVVVSGHLTSDLDNATYTLLTDRFRESMAGLPGVRRMTYASSLPFAHVGAMLRVKIDGSPDIGEIDFDGIRVATDYFEAMGVPLLEGRSFINNRPGDPPVAIINELAAKRFFPGGSALGHYIEPEQFGRWEIVGVARDVRRFGPRDELRPQVYAPIHQPPFNNSQLCGMLQMDGPVPAGFEAMVRRAAYAADPRLVVRVQPVAQAMKVALDEDRRNATVFELLSGLALILAATGLFALMAYTVAQREREFGVRVALGATRGRLLWSAVRRGLRLAGLGTVVGLAAAVALAQFMQATLHEMSAYEPSIYVAVAVLQICIATLACWIPARRAARADPLKLLRTD